MKKQRFVRSAIALACSIFTLSAYADISISASSFVRGQNVAMCSGSCIYGTGLLLNAPPYTGAADAAEWDFDIPTSGKYELFVEYAAAESRPVTISFNGLVAFTSGLAATTGGWMLANSKVISQGTVQLSAGKTTMRVARSSVFPHIKGFKLVPVEATISTPTLTTCNPASNSTATTGQGTTQNSGVTISTPILCTPPTLKVSTSNGVLVGSEFTFSIQETPSIGVSYKLCAGTVSNYYNLGCMDYTKPITFTLSEGFGNFYVAAKSIGSGAESAYSNEIQVSPVLLPSPPKYPVIFLHGLDSSYATWDQYKIWGQANIPYGGTLVAIDKFHVTTTGTYSNKNLPAGGSQAGCPTEKDATGLYDVRYYYGCNAQGGYFTINFSNNNDLSFAAQAMELRAIVDAVTKLTGKPKVFLVGHSMGGLASRAYIQYLGGGSKVAGLITIGTPHQGALTTIGAGAWAISADVKQMLAPNSVDLNMLNDLNANPWNPNVKTYAIALNQENSSTPGDNIVGEQSQRNGGLWEGITVSPSDPTFVGIGHRHETDDAGIRAEVEKKLFQWSRIVP